MAVKGIDEIKGIGNLIEETVVDKINSIQDKYIQEIPTEYYSFDDEFDDDGELSQEEIIRNLNKKINGFSDYDLYNGRLGAIDHAIDVSDLPEGYRFQGFTFSESFVYITAYDKDSDGLSVILVYDHKGNYLGKMFLPKGAGGDAHVGGVSYDSEHNILYITGTRGTVLVLDNNLIENAINKQKENGIFNFNLDRSNNDFVIDDKNINLFYSLPIGLQQYLKTTGDSLNAASVYYDKKSHKLYVPTYSAHSKVYVFNVKFDKGNPGYEFDKIYGLNEATEQKDDDVDLPPAIQGVSIYTNKKGEQYLLTASSCGGKKSIIVKYKINSDGSLSLVGGKILMKVKGAENMMIDEDDGLVYINVENNVGGSKQNGGKFYCYDIENHLNEPFIQEDYDDVTKALSNSARLIDNNSDYYNC